MDNLEMEGHDLIAEEYLLRAKIGIWDRRWRWFLPACVQLADGSAFFYKRFQGKTDLMNVLEKQIRQDRIKRYQGIWLW